MTTPSPDKIEIPDAAVEAAMEKLRWQLPADDGTGEIWRIVRLALAAAIPHMPDRGYAEVGVKPPEWVEDDETAAASSLGMTYNLFLRDGVWKGYADGYANWFLDSVGTLIEVKAAAQADYEARIRSALIAPPAPADNGEPLRKIIDDAVIETASRSPGRRGPYVFDEADLQASAAARATPSPIEDVAGPSEAEGLCRRRAMSQWEASLKRPDLDEKSRVQGAVDAALRQALAIGLLHDLAARRVRPSPVDEDARDGVLEEAAKVAEAEPTLLWDDSYGREMAGIRKAHAAVIAMNIRALKHGGQE